MNDIESRIKPRLTALGASFALLAFLVGCGKASLSEAASGTSSLSRETALKVDATLHDLEAFAASLAPVRVDFKDARAVELWLEDFRSRRIKQRGVDAWQILRDLAVDDAATVAARYGWDTTQLLANLEAAQLQLQSIAAAITPGA